MSGASLVAAGKTFSNVIGTIPESWTPASLFIDKLAYRGAWFDVSDLTTLFQDTAGTTPVTAAGQTVGLLKDKSGHGSHITFTGATLGSDGTLYWINFDGSTTKGTFVASGNNMFSFAGYCMASMGLLLDLINTYREVLHINDGSNVTRFGLATYAAPSPLVFGAHRVSYATETDVATGLPTPTGPHVWTAFAKFAAGGVNTLAVGAVGSGGTPGTYPLVATGGGGSGFQGTVTVGSGGAISATTITESGINFTANPVISAPGSGLTGATITATVGGITTLTRDKTVATSSGSLSTRGLTDGAASNGMWLGNYNGTSYADMRFYGGIFLGSEVDISLLQGQIETWVGSKVGLTI